MKKQKSGAIVNIASAAGLLFPGGAGPYNVTKAGVIAISETLCQELAEYGVTVSAVCPVFIKTNLLANMRTTEQKQLKRAEREFERTKWTAERAAQVILKKAARGDLYIIPQREGRILWRIKRLMPTFFTKRLITCAYKAGRWIEKCFAKSLLLATRF